MGDRVGKVLVVNAYWGLFDTSLILGILIITQVYLDNSQVYLGVEGEGIKAHGTDEVDMSCLKEKKGFDKRRRFLKTNCERPSFGLTWICSIFVGDP